jgi:hypothetical protein
MQPGPRSTLVRFSEGCDRLQPIIDLFSITPKSMVSIAILKIDPEKPVVSAR